MTTLPTVSLDHNPAVLRKDWLPPDTQFDDLNEAAAAHQALLAEPLICRTNALLCAASSQVRTRRKRGTARSAP